MAASHSSSIFQAIKANRRYFMSSTLRNNPLNYLQTWVGNTELSPSSTKKTLEKGANLHLKTRSGLTVSGVAYLLPTLRLERNETPNSLSTRLEHFLEHSGTSTTASIRTLLLPKAINETKSEGKQKVLKVPIILDMISFQHDGSPHYNAPTEGSLKRFVEVLNNWGISVLGLTNISTSRNTANELSGNGDSTVTELEREAMRLGLPVLMSRTGRTLGGTSNGMNSLGTESEGESLQLESLILKQVESSNYASNPVKSVDAITHEESVPHTLPVGAKIFHGSVRSGQQVSTDKPNQSLVVIGNVNSGGEVMAEGDLYIFGRLRGRALAGLAFNKFNSDEDCHSNSNNFTHASIFASNFDPELICIGESFSTIDSIEELGLNRAETGAMVTVDRNGELIFTGF